MKFYHDIRNELFDNNLGVLACFIDYKDNVLLFLVNSGINGVSYMMYDVYAEKMIPMNSQKAIETVSRIPFFDPFDTKGFWGCTKEEEVYIDEYIKTRQYNADYIKYIETLKKRASKEDLIMLLDCIIRKADSLKKEVNNAINTAGTMQVQINGTSTINVKGYSSVPAFIPGIKQKKEHSYVSVVVASAIGFLLGLASAVLAAGVSGLI